MKKVRWSNISPALITIFWLFMVYTLVAWHILPERRIAQYSLIDPRILAMQWQDVEEWNWIRKDGQTFGASRLTIEEELLPDDTPPEEQTYMLYQNLDLRAPILGLTKQIESAMTLRLNALFQVQDFVAVLESAPLRLEIDGYVDKKRLYFRVRTGDGDPAYLYLELENPISLLAAVQPLITRHFDLQVGDEYTVPVVNPLGGMSKLDATVEVAAKESIEIDGKDVEVYRLDTTSREITRSRWVRSEGVNKGVTVRAELFQGLVTERSTKAEIIQQYLELARELDIPEFDRETYEALAVPIGSDGTGGGMPLDLLGNMMGGQ
ncbi:MAG: hypothetical protein ACLFUS_00520 [Candidatus Sumerlaeia bacterium]